MTHTKELNLIYRKYRNYNPQYVTVNEKEYEIDNIIIYDGEKTLLKFKWFEQDRIFLDTEIKLRRKLNLTRKENFIINSKEPHLFRKEKRYNLYIYHKNIQIKYQGLIVRAESVYKSYKIIDALQQVNMHRVYLKSLWTKQMEIKDKLENTLQELQDRLSIDKSIPEEELEDKLNEIRNLNNDLEKEIQNVEKTKQQIQQGIIKEEGLKC